MTPAFDATNVATWPVILTVDHVSAIYHRTAGAIRKACQTHQFIPAPFQRRPSLWRRADVLRHVEGARSFGSIQKAS